MESHLSISDVKNRLSAIINHVEAGNCVKETRHGKPVTVILSISEYERLSGKQKDFWESYTTFMKEVSPEDLVQDDLTFDDPRDRSAGRDME